MLSRFLPAWASLVKGRWEPWLKTATWGWTANESVSVKNMKIVLHCIKSRLRLRLWQNSIEVQKILGPGVKKSPKKDQSCPNVGEGAKRDQIRVMFSFRIWRFSDSVNDANSSGSEKARGRCPVFFHFAMTERNRWARCHWTWRSWASSSSSCSSSSSLTWTDKQRSRLIQSLRSRGSSRCSSIPNSKDAGIRIGDLRTSDSCCSSHLATNLSFLSELFLLQWNAVVKMNLFVYVLFSVPLGKVSDSVNLS